MIRVASSTPSVNVLVHLAASFLVAIPVRDLKRARHPATGSDESLQGSCWVRSLCREENAEFACRAVRRTGRHQQTWSTFRHFREQTAPRAVRCCRHVTCLIRQGSGEIPFLHICPRPLLRSIGCRTLGQVLQFVSAGKLRCRLHRPASREIEDGRPNQTEGNSRCAHAATLAAPGLLGQSKSKIPARTPPNSRIAIDGI